MTAEELLRHLHVLEKPSLQTNDWARLRIRVADLIAATCPPAIPADIIDLLLAWRLDGRGMFLRDCERWRNGDDAKYASLVTSRARWYAAPWRPHPPSWQRRKVFVPAE